MPTLEEHTPVEHTPTPNHSRKRSAGFWLALFMGLAQAVNAVRAFIDPIAFAEYMGLPLAMDDQVAFVVVYGLRTGFIAAVIFLFLAKGWMQGLAVMALCGIALPLGDAWLVMRAEAPTPIVIRHLLICMYLVVTAVILHKQGRAYEH